MIMIELALGAVTFVLAAWSILRGVREARVRRMMELRRVWFSERKDRVLEKWYFDLAEMLATYEHRVFGPPQARSHMLYDLRRAEGSRWEVRLHPECLRLRLAALEKDAAIHATAEEWRPVEAQHASQLELQYQRFLRGYNPKPTLTVVSLVEDWRRWDAEAKATPSTRSAVGL